MPEGEKKTELIPKKIWVNNIPIHIPEEVVKEIEQRVEICFGNYCGLWTMLNGENYTVNKELTKICLASCGISGVCEDFTLLRRRTLQYHQTKEDYK